MARRRKICRRLVGYDQVQASLFPESNVRVDYCLAGTTDRTEVVAINALQIDVTRSTEGNAYAEPIVPSSMRLTMGGHVYVHKNSAVYMDPSPASGTGVLAGTLDISSGVMTLSQWAGGGAATVRLDALATRIGAHWGSSVVFRTALGNLKPGTFQVLYSEADGTARSKTVGQSGLLEDDDCYIALDHLRGQVDMKFGEWRIVANLTPEEMAEDWYDPDAIEIINEVEMIWRPAVVDLSTIVYNAVAQVMLPPDSDLVGVNAVRLPPDGRALTVRRGMLALVHHTADLAPQALSAGQTISCGRTRLYRVVIDDANGARLPADLYTVDRELGTVTMATPLDLTDYTGPYTIRHTVADLSRVRDTDINGTVTMLRQVSHDYPDGSYLSGLLFAGTLQARVSDVFEQTTWTGVWQDTRIGDQPLASYNLAAFPIAVTNAGAYKDRMLVKFTSATEFQVIGENLGLVGIGNVNEDCTPINPLTSQPYFSIDYRGWGGGWATGNCLRFNLHAASYPVDLIRAVQPSNPTGQSDCVELLLVGNVDA